MDCVIVKTYDADGRVTGERRFAGLFTLDRLSRPGARRAAAARPGRGRAAPRRPRRPTAMTARRCWPSSNAYPRDELFQIDEDTLYDHALGILQLQERRRVALFARRDRRRPLRDLPGVRAARALRCRAERPLRRILEHAWHGKVTSIAGSGSSDSALAQALYTLKLDTPATRRRPTSPSSSSALADAATSWNDRLRAALQASPARSRAARRPAAGATGSPPAYRDTFDADAGHGRPRAAAGGARRPAVRRAARTARAGMPPHRFTLRLFHPKEPIALSDILPLAENLGLRVLSEAPFQLQAPGATRPWRCRC